MLAKPAWVHLKPYSYFVLWPRANHTCTDGRVHRRVHRQTLLSLTCGDIGTDEVKMEEQSWRDGSDSRRSGVQSCSSTKPMYLEKRQMTDLKRNSLVSGKELAFESGWCTTWEEANQHSIFRQSSCGVLSIVGAF